MYRRVAKKEKQKLALTMAGSAEANRYEVKQNVTITCPIFFFNNAKPTYALHSIRQSQLRNKYIGTKVSKESSLAVIYELQLEGLPTIL